ncbi:DUF4097 family beta strand repeat-containing protein [Gluconobacter cerinus]|uniref:DUF4097 family beta strand repeat-containing protein n=1 Tax=Gluconobacter cerinus TaxID=38307 RepID=UPI001B8D3580|nr:DUF4097 family beta strand repeat-containing protein [Gluconobacter cerinus]MBS1033161.1 DUF4097 family beta strand repeat protein [Gluconobacter cerinus]
MPVFRAVFPVLLAATCLTSSALSAPLSQSTSSEDLSYATLPEGGIISTISGDVEVKTSSGPLSIRSVSGDTDVSSSNGPVSVSTVSGDTQIGQIQGALQIKSVSGDVTVAGAAMLMTVSGDAHLEKAAGDVTAKSSSGDQDITLTSAPNARTVLLESASGDITLHLPKGFGGTFDIQLRQGRSQKDFPLEQSLGLAVNVGPWEKPSLVSSESRKITASGKVGDGKDHVTLRDVSGTIRIVQD